MTKSKELVDYGLPEEAFNLLTAEDLAQLAKWGIQHHDMFQWLAFITEELGELSAAISEYVFRDSNLDEIVTEATQVATLALKVAWMVKSGTYL